MDLPSSASYHHHIKQAEAVTGKIQVGLHKKSESKTRMEEIVETKNMEDFKTHVCTVKKHRHVPLSHANWMLW